MAKVLHHSENQKLFFDEDLSVSSKKSRKTDNYIVKVSFRKESKKFSNIPTVEVNDALRTVFCNSKISIGEYDIAKKGDCFEIKLYSQLDKNLLNLILTKSVSVIGLKYKCDSCKLEIEGNNKTVCFYY